MKLAELIDLENQILEDNKLDPSELRKRDRAIGIEFDSQKLDRKQLFLAWLGRVQKPDDSSLGKRVESVYGWLKVALVIAGLLFGAAAASATLAFDGTNPVNVVHFLAVFVGLQTLFLLIFLLTQLPPVLVRFLPGHGGLSNLVRALGFLLGKGLERLFSHLPAEKARTLQHDLNRLKLRQKIYQKIERWLLASLTQRFGVAFNVGALAVCLYLIIFSDLAFAWNTTLRIQSATFHTIVETISTPWAALLPHAVPSPELVEISRYFRIEGQYQVAGETARSLNPEAVGGWWAFLVLSLATYGLLPRLVTFAITLFKYRSSLRHAPLDAAEFEALYDRLTTPIIETRAPVPESDLIEHHASTLANIDIPPSGKTCSVVLWGEMAIDNKRAEETALQRFGWTCERVLPAGGFDARLDEQVCAALTADKKDRSPVLVLVESWEVPNKSVLHFLKKLRLGSDPKRPLLIGLVNTGGNGAVLPPEKDDWQNWREVLAELSDPYLRVETMAVTA